MAYDPERLRIALLIYRGNPLSGGQGVYTRHLARELVALGHEVTVFSGLPYPQLDAGVGFVPVPQLDLYKNDTLLRWIWPSEIRDRLDLREIGLFSTGMFPEPDVWSHRIRRVLQDRRADFDIIHDNQCLGDGILAMVEGDGWPLLATVHHPITKDRDLELAAIESLPLVHRLRRRMGIKLWYRFLTMQTRVVRRLPHMVTVSESSRRDIVAQLHARPEAMSVVPVAADHATFRPMPDVARVPGRIMCTSSADVPLKGMVPMMEAFAKVRADRPDAHLVVIGKPRTGGPVDRTVDRLGLREHITFARGIDDDALVRLYAEAEVAVVPSLYEGFSLPAIEAMSAGVPLVATTGGALPEVAGTSGETALLVPPGDPDALAVAILRMLGDEGLRDRIGAAGRERALSKFTWKATAEGTAEIYRRILAEHDALAATAPATATQG
jgi:glycosyltransferase involved in cell wall biosynthesis